MQRTIPAACLLLLAASPALADPNPVTLTFKGLIEHGANGTGGPIGAPFGRVGILTIVLDANAPGRPTATGILYEGGYACGNGDSQSAIISATISTLPNEQFGAGACDSITIQNNANGESSISFFSGQVEVGQTLSLRFTAPGSTTLPLTFPTKIDTRKFDRATFSLSLPTPISLFGDMVTRK